jgi:excinuclease ABC subunit C
MPEIDPSICPHAPGVYLFKDRRGRIIYVGKARDLRKRVGSYFRSGEQLPRKTRVMLQHAAILDYVLTGTEKEALLLESSLIKKHKPRYNVILRDDKSYILFRLDVHSTYPRLQLTRSVHRDGSKYFGPFTSATAARQTLKAVNRLFPIRKCRDSVFRNRTRPCLQYSMGRCLAPCVKEVPVEEYWRNIRRLELFLSGRSSELLRTLRSEMESASKDLDFERAASLRDQIRAVEATVEKQSVILPQGGDVDAVGLSRTRYGLALGVVFIRRGSLLDGRSFYWESAESANGVAEQPAEAEGENGDSRDLEQDRDILRTFLTQFYTATSYIPEEIVLPLAVRDPVLEDLLTERRGGPVALRAADSDRDRRLLDLAEKNARQGKPELADSPVPASLAASLKLQRAPRRIEAVDASHLAGEGPVVGQVVLEEGRFKKEEYRQYKFPELEGSADDYAALAGWARRRAGSDQPAPDMLLIDGGRGQLAVVERAAREAQGRDGSLPLRDTALVALSKGEDTDLVFRPGRKNPLKLKKGDPVLLFLQNIRDNAHRFVLSRQKRSRKQKTLQSELEGLPGIGQKTARQLWDRFGSMERIRELSREDLEALPGFGPRRAEKVLEGIRRGGDQ